MSNQTFFDHSAEFVPIVSTLKQRLNSELTSSVQIWDKLKTQKNQTWLNYFSNQNIKMEDDEGIVKDKIENFDDLFSYISCRRVVISGDDGYGKTTVVQEMVRQWVDGRSEWTSEFSLVFLFRLNDVTGCKLITLPKLLERSLTADQAKLAYNCLKNKRFAQKILLIFDGVDEIRSVFSDEINDLIVGTDPFYAPFVILTMKPGDHCDRLKGLSCFSIRLNGFTKDSVKEDGGNLLTQPENTLFHMLKIPLFNVLYKLTSIEGAQERLSYVRVVKRYVKLLAERYRRTNSLYGKLQHKELVQMLGQAAQAKYSMINVRPNVGTPKLTEKFFNFAISIGYIRECSMEDDVVFSHRFLADYFASCFWTKVRSIKAKPSEKYLEMVEFVEPHHGFCSALSLFSSMLTYRDKNYKLHLWNNFTEYVPLLDDYTNLPSRSFDSPILRFPDVSSEATGAIFDSLEFNVYGNVQLKLYNAKFETNVPLNNLKQFQKISLFNTSLDVSPLEFFRTYNFQRLELELCTFRTEASDIEDPKQSLNLERLQLISPDENGTIWLNFVMHNASKLRWLYLEDAKVDDSWVAKLQSNETVLKSLTNFTLCLKSPTSMAFLLSAINGMSNLVQLSLKGCYLSQPELHVLIQYFEKSAKKLRRLCLEEDENVGKCNHLMKSLGKLTSLKDLELARCKITKDALDNLQTAFRLLNAIEKCSFVNENIVNNNSKFLSALNDCPTLKEIIFDRCGVFETELELAKSLLNRFTVESQNVMRSGRADTVVRFFK